MSGLSSAVTDFKSFLSDNVFNKIFIICGENSFIGSGADKLINDQLKNKRIVFCDEINIKKTTNQTKEILLNRWLKLKNYESKII